MLFKTNCSLCSSEVGFLLDCHCLLCDGCFQQKILTFYLGDDSITDGNLSFCKFCKEPTAFESLNLHDLSNKERLETLCHFYAVNNYLKLKKGLLAWVFRKEQKSVKLISELKNSIENLKLNEDLYKSFCQWCINHYKVSIKDIDPKILVKDRQKLLRPLFIDKENNKSLIEVQFTATNGLDDTHKKDSLTILQNPHPFRQKINELQPFFGSPLANYAKPADKEAILNSSSNKKFFLNELDTHRYLLLKEQKE